MGTKGDQMADNSAFSAEKLLRSLSSLGNIRTKKMFGGFGVFEDDTMFALVDSSGGIFFKVDDTNLRAFEEAGSMKHARMPYYRVPEAVIDDDNALLEWANRSINVARNAKKS